MASRRCAALVSSPPPSCCFPPDLPFSYTLSLSLSLSFSLLCSAHLQTQREAQHKLDKELLAAEDLASLALLSIETCDKTVHTKLADAITFLQQRAKESGELRKQAQRELTQCEEALERLLARLSSCQESLEAKDVEILQLQAQIAGFDSEAALAAEADERKRSLLVQQPADDKGIEEAVSRVREREGEKVSDNASPRRRMKLGTNSASAAHSASELPAAKPLKLNISQQYPASPSPSPETHASQGDASPGQAGYVGLKVTDAPPHAVVEVNDLVDANFVRHDQPGYTNPAIAPGDRILKIDGIIAEHVSVETLHGMLLGEAATPVRLLLARPSGTVYVVTAMRHALHAFDALGSRSGNLSREETQASQDNGHGMQEPPLLTSSQPLTLPLTSTAASAFAFPPARPKNLAQVPEEDLSISDKHTRQIVQAMTMLQSSVASRRHKNVVAFHGASVMPSASAGDNQGFQDVAHQQRIAHLQEALSHQTALLQSETSLRQRLQHRISRLEGMGMVEGGAKAPANSTTSNSSDMSQDSPSTQLWQANSPRQRVLLLERYRDQLEEEFIQYQAELARLHDDKVQAMRENMNLKGRFQMLQALSSSTRHSFYPASDPSNISNSPPPIPSSPHLLPRESPGESTITGGRGGQGRGSVARDKPGVGRGEAGGTMGGRTPRVDEQGMSTITRWQRLHRMEETNRLERDRQRERERERKTEREKERKTEREEREERESARASEKARVYQERYSTI